MSDNKFEYCLLGKRFCAAFDSTKSVLEIGDEVWNVPSKAADEPEVRVHIFMYGSGLGEGKNSRLCFMGEDADDLETWLNNLVSNK